MFISFRPDWSSCGEYISGGDERWKAISENQTSAQLVDILLSEIAGTSNNAAGAEYFDGKVRLH